MTSRPCSKFKAIHAVHGTDDITITIFLSKVTSLTPELILLFPAACLTAKPFSIADNYNLSQGWQQPLNCKVLITRYTGMHLGNSVFKVPHMSDW